MLRYAAKDEDTKKKALRLRLVSVGMVKVRRTPVNCLSGCVTERSCGEGICLVFSSRQHTLLLVILHHMRTYVGLREAEQHSAQLPKELGVYPNC